MRFSPVPFLGIAAVAGFALGPVPVFAQEAGIPSVPSAASTVTPVVPDAMAPVPAAPAPPTFLVFQMADGRFFHPASGLTADSEAALRLLVLGPGASDPGTVIAPSSPPADSAEPVLPAVDPLVAAIRRAQAQLREAVAADRAAQTAERVVKAAPTTLGVTLAVWDRTTDQLRLLPARLRGTELRLLEEDESGDGEDWRVLRANGVNSEIVASGDADQVVVALRYPILRALNGKPGSFALEDVVYVPYSRLLHTPATVQEGERYLDDLVRTVFDRLRADAVRSRAYPDRLLADVVDPAMVKAIAAIEHMDASALEKDPKVTLERFFVTLGGNQGDSYNYARSSASALGLVQFIPSTYNRLAARTEWGLDADFERGMRSHENAVRAQAIYLDTLLTEFPESVRQTFLADPLTASEYIVAAYNGGSGRVRRAIASWPQIFTGERTRTLQSLQKQYDAAFAKAESLRQKTLAEKDKKKRAALQKQLDAQRVVYRGLKAKVDALQASLLRQETIGYVEKYRLTRADERFLPRASLTAVPVSTRAVLE